MRTFLAVGTTLALLVIVEGVGAQEQPAPRPLPSMPTQSAPVTVQQPAPVVQTSEFQPSGRRSLLRRLRERRMARRAQ